MPRSRSLLLFLCVLCASAVVCLAAPQDDYQLGPDSQPRNGVPRGTVTKHEWASSKIFPDTWREYWVYVPAQYKADQPACVMVFQDGRGYVNEKGAFRAPIVFDNLIAAGQMPVTIGVFINPGAHPDRQGGQQDKSKWRTDNRSFEYDTLSDVYARFLLDEILPEVAKEYKLTDDPNGRAICGLSSGGICSFTVAWQRPDAFRKVLSQIGSFTSIAYRSATAEHPLQPGGDLYPTLIRKNPIKPLRIYLQDGSNDLNNEHGNWFLANQQMLSAIEWANTNADKKNIQGPRYEVNHEWGHGTHNPNHGGAILPESLRWLWKDYKSRQ
ncbi:MAG TPA: alpha/beta hydrolase-fold protein [Tepidisphaeraceae bacterium]|jgi:enterochelin esterase family protein